LEPWVSLPPGQQALSPYLGGFRFPECRKAPRSLRGGRHLAGDETETQVKENPS
jgi:hypothetical protein